MHTYFPTFWPNGPNVDHSAATVHLSELLPAVGTTTAAYFERSDRVQVGETIRLIWNPPVSDLNGWSEQPSEIALSYLLIAIVVSDASAPIRTARDPRFLHEGKQTLALEILSCERLLTVLKASPAGSGDWRLLEIGGEQGVHLAWDEVSWCGKATVEGLIYLTANTRNETSLALLLAPDGDEIMGLFSLHIDPGGSEFGFGRRRLTADEKRSVQRALDRAHLLHDTQPAYLVTGDT
ncbi:hypothetical protein [Pseudomonas vanderleydeniana]|uniref:Uncharacterized protein n=1 Tax=Pseudomonas vanderleydeniana TaxID=2745495 RepID=A0A9E6PH07_9PSED|nr:hypothetical protein [Pseudomonas vanderleydeniana]QXI26267.1 hypothetical protein HU752_020185 [Pseudomonas vanderleydeniana]